MANPDKITIIDNSHDSVVLLHEGTPYPVDNIPFCDSSNTVCKLMDPLQRRLDARRFFATIDKYVSETNRLSELGIQLINVPILGTLAIMVVPAMAIMPLDQTAPSIVSPYVPGPKLDSFLEIAQSNLQLLLSDLSPEEQGEISTIMSRMGNQCPYILRDAYARVQTKLREASFMTHLDPVNIKLRWDNANNCPAFVVTDIQHHIGDEMVL